MNYVEFRSVEGLITEPSYYFFASSSEFSFADHYEQRNQILGNFGTPNYFLSSVDDCAFPVLAALAVCPSSSSEHCFVFFIICELKDVCLFWGLLLDLFDL
jgi:hypothetical protein